MGRGKRAMKPLARRTMLVSAGAAALATTLLGHVPEAGADDAPATAEVTIIHAKKCEKKTVDPEIGEAPPALGYECLKYSGRAILPLVLNKPSTTSLPNHRTFQLVHTAKVHHRYKVTASVSPADGGAGFVKLADITADPNKPFTVGGFAHDGGVIVLKVRILSPPGAAP